jgi:hypothetical protein
VASLNHAVGSRRGHARQCCTGPYAGRSGRAAPSVLVVRKNNQASLQIQSVAVILPRLNW